MRAAPRGARCAALSRRAARVLFWLLLGLPHLASGAAAAPQAVVLQIDGAIGPAVADYVVRELRGVRQGETRLVVLRMNTPGGLDTSMREIVRAILSSSVPVATYVAPSGARAASAGTYIAYASAIAAMAPGTNLGAATPIRLGAPGLPGGAPQQPAGQKEKGGEGATSSSEPADAETRKAVNDAVAYIRGLAELNGRNADWAAEAVRTAVSLPASEALKLNVIELLAVITDPNVAFLLMLLGVYGLIFEFLNPGAVAPGLVGGISLLVALYALNLLPINYAGAALVLLGIGLMVAEAHIGSFGVIGVAGIVAFVIGAIMMFPSGAPGFTLSLSVVAAATIMTAALFLLVLTMLLRSRRHPVVTGKEGLLGAEGETVAWGGDEGRVRVNGEIWRARAQRPLEAGARIKVIDREGLVLVVEPA